VNATVLNALADPFGGSPGVEGPIRTSTGDQGPGGNPVGSATGRRIGLLGGLNLRDLWHPTSPVAWFGFAGVVTFAFIAVSHGHIGGEASGHVGPAHVEATVGHEGD
jgi:hypothetical protein